MIQRIKSKFIKLIKSKRINVFLLFLALSFMFLLLTKLTKDYTKTISFNIEPINAKENYVILNDSTHKLEVTLSTYGFKLLRYYLFKPHLTVNLNELSAKDKQYIWTNSKGIAHINSQFSENVKIVAVNPDTIVFKYDVNGIKKVPVHLNSDIKFAPGFDSTEDFRIAPDSIKIIGPQILLDSINIIQTEKLSLDNINQNIEQTLNIVLPDSSLNLVYSQKQVQAIGIVEKFTEGSIEVPIDVINVPNTIKINYFPKTVNVTYYTSLDNFKNVKTSDFIIECDYTSLKKENTFLEPKLTKYPKNIKNVKLGQKHVEFIISK